MKKCGRQKPHIPTQGKEKVILKSQKHQFSSVQVQKHLERKT